MANYNQFTGGPRRIPKVLFFQAGMVATDEEYEAAAKYAPNVGMRNAALVAAMPMSPIEECDAVAGLVPERYRKVYPDVSDFDGEATMLRMSDLDRFSGNVTDADNEAKRAAKPPAIGQDQVNASGAPRPAGAIITEAGGFVAPTPGDPDALPPFGGERAENAPAGTNAALRPATSNPHNLPEGGIAMVRPGQDPETITAPVVADPTNVGPAGFTAPQRVDEEAETPRQKKARERREAAE